ncbi:MAG: tetratricopeptide repeat protein [Kofleriaceae bacterium]|nr:tetratricopeptide repeat protein [Kofleriaceae bacterium]
MRTALVLLVIAACSGKGEKAAPVPTPGSGSGPAAETATPKAANEPPKPDKKAEKGQLPAEDPEAHKKYRAALNKGRKATDAKNYKDAIAAFDEALAIKKGDARAISERGYARLLSGDLDGASRDLDDSATRTKDRKLLSSIWYNRGLVDEKRGKQDGALVAFYMANALRPTDAAKKKIEGKTVCPVTIERPYEREGEFSKAWEATDWQDLARQAVEDLEGSVPPPRPKRSKR